MNSQKVITFIATAMFATVLVSAAPVAAQDRNWAVAGTLAVGAASERG